MSLGSLVPTPPLFLFGLPCETLYVNYALYTKKEASLRGTEVGSSWEVGG